MRIIIKIDTGLYRADSNKGALGQIWEIFSRFTWQLPQTLAGNMYASGLNFFGGVKGISHGYGMTAIETYSDRESAVTLSLYSAGPRGYKADYRDHLFVHEYGHYLQSQQMGPAFLLAVGLPSLQSTLVQRADGAISHHDRWFEADASYKGMKYFDKHYGGNINDRGANSDRFDRESFVTGNPSPYINPRTNQPNRASDPYYTTSYYHWTDITTYLPFLGSFFH